MNRPLLRLGFSAMAALLHCGPEGFERVFVDDARDLRGVDIDADGDGWIVGRQGALHRVDAGRVTVGTYSFEDSTGRVRTPDLFATTLHRAAGWAVGDGGLALELIVGRNNGADDPSPIDTPAEAENTGEATRWLTTVEVTPSILLAGGERGRVRMRENERWTAVDADAPGAARITGAWSAGETIVLTTDQGVIVERDSRGRWSAQTVTTETATVPAPLFDVWSSTVGADLYVVGLGGALFRRDADGGEWTQIPTPSFEDLYAIDGRSDDEIYAVGASGTIVEFDGSEWSRTPSGTGRDLFDVRAVASEVIAVGDGGTVVRRSN